MIMCHKQKINNNIIWYKHKDRLRLNSPTITMKMWFFSDLWWWEKWMLYKNKNVCVMANFSGIWHKCVPFLKNIFFIFISPPEEFSSCIKCPRVFDFLNWIRYFSLLKFVWILFFCLFKGETCNMFVCVKWLLIFLTPIFRPLIT